MVLYCHVKKGDKVLIKTGKFKQTVSVVNQVVRFTNPSTKKDFFKLALNDLPKKTVKNKKTNSLNQVDVLIDSSNVEILESK